MDLRLILLSRLYGHFKQRAWTAEFEGFTWEDVVFLRACRLQLEHGDTEAWDALVKRLAADRKLAQAAQRFFERIWPGLASEDAIFLQSTLVGRDRGDTQVWDRLAERSTRDRPFAHGIDSFLDGMGCGLDQIAPRDMDDLLVLLQPPTPSESPAAQPRTRPANSQIMYIERKAGRLVGEARIGRVALSKTGKTLYYQGKRFQSQKGAGFKSNYIDVETGEDYWISRPRRDGQDRLYRERLAIEIDEDAREEYWRVIRNQPENVDKKVV